MNPSSRRLYPALSLLLVLLPFAVQPAWSEAEKVTFRFAPPLGKTFIQTLVTTKTTDQGAGKKRTDVTRGEARLRFDKTPDGYTLTATPIATQMQRDGQTVENPLLSALDDLVITMRLDTQGNILAIKGYEKLEKRLQEALPPEVFAAVSKLLSAEAMVAKEEAEWAGRVTDFVGKTVETGETWTSTAPYALPTGGAIDFHVVTEFAGKTRCGERDCWKINFRYDSDVSALGKAVGGLVNDMARSAGGTEILQVTGARITGSGERIVDPTTMLIYSETTERTLTMENAGAQITTQEKRESTLREEQASQ